MYEKLRTTYFFMVSIGVDPSINSTGICVSDGKKYTYYIITSKMTRKMEAFSHKYIHLVPYEKTETKDLEYTEKESVKTRNFANICEKVRSIIKKHKPDNIKMEGVSYGSTGSAALVDLSGLNFMLRQLFLIEKVPFVIVSPSQNKKFAVANGSADKDIMIDAWKRMDSNISDVSDIKIDDLADSFFLACYQPASN